MAQKAIFSKINRIEDTRYGYYSERKIGEGYGGVIYEGVDLITSQPMAVKVLNYNSRVKDQISLTEMLKITQQEYQKVENIQLQGTRLVRIYDIIQMDKTFIIMQLCDCNLKQYLSQKTNINQSQILKIIKNIVEGLLIVEREGYHFSDLKPQNILMTRSGQAKLGDLQSLINLDCLNSKTKQKFRNQIFGTLHYMAPEVVQFGEYGPYNYIWTLGVILHQIIYHQPPFTVIPQISQPTREQKHQHIASFYKNLFNLHICQDKQNSYPKSQHLLRNLLRLNERKRINLHKLYEFLSKENQNVNQTCRDLSIEFTQKLRSSSQITIDTSFNQELTDGLNISQFTLKELSVHKTCQQFHHNQKQNQCHWYVSETLSSSKRQEKEVSHHKQQQTSKSAENALAFRTQLFNETLSLIDKIQSPAILVKKLDELKKDLIESQRQLLAQSSQKEQKIIQDMWCSCKKLIKASRAYSHLQKTVKYSTSFKDKQLNSKEINLWEHLNQLLQNREIKLIKTHE